MILESEGLLPESTVPFVALKDHSCYIQHPQEFNRDTVLSALRNNECIKSSQIKGWTFMVCPEGVKVTMTKT
jgi:predicted ABC-type ATPase